MISYAVIFLYIAVALGEYSSFKRILVSQQVFVLSYLLDFVIQNLKVRPKALGFETARQNSPFTWRNSQQLITVKATATYELQVPLIGKSLSLRHRLNELVNGWEVPTNYDFALIIIKSVIHLLKILINNLTQARQK